MVHEDVQGGAGGYGDRSADANLLCQAQEVIDSGQCATVEPL